MNPIKHKAASFAKHWFREAISLKGPGEKTAKGIMAILAAAGGASFLLAMQVSIGVLIWAVLIAVWLAFSCGVAYSKFRWSIIKFGNPVCLAGTGISHLKVTNLGWGEPTFRIQVVRILKEDGSEWSDEGGLKGFYLLTDEKQRLGQDAEVPVLFASIQQLPGNRSFLCPQFNSNPPLFVHDVEAAKSRQFLVFWLLVRASAEQSIKDEMWLRMEFNPSDGRSLKLAQQDPPPSPVPPASKT